MRRILLVSGSLGAVLIALTMLLPAARSARTSDRTAVHAPPRVDPLGDPLPEGAIARLGTTRMRHFHPPGRYCWGIGSIAWSPDGKTIATTTCDDKTGVEARIWSASTGKARSLQVAGWIKDLDHDSFAVRDKATRELASLGDLVRAPLRQALAANPPLETRRRLQQLLDEMNQLQPAQLRCLRAIDVLERIGTPGSVAILERLTQGNPESRVTTESRTVLAQRKHEK